MQLYAVQTGQTIWEQQNRMDSLGGVPLSDEGRDVIIRVGKELVPHEPAVIYASCGEAEQQTAELLAKRLAVKVKTETLLSEVDFGLWQGLTLDEIKRRQPKLHKQWIESPASVRPPGGETLQEAQDRIWQIISEIRKKEKKPQLIVVLRPMVMGLLRCRLQSDSLDHIWQHVSAEFTWASYEMDEVNV